MEDVGENRLLDSGFIIETLSFYSLSVKGCGPLKIAQRCSPKIQELFVFI